MIIWYAKKVVRKYLNKTQILSLNHQEYSYFFKWEKFKLKYNGTQYNYANR